MSKPKERLEYLRGVPESRIARYCPCGECPLDRALWSESCKKEDEGPLEGDDDGSRT